MNKKNIFKIAVDIAMIALFVTFFNIGLLGFKFHVIGGIIFGALILVHIIVNRKWVVNITKRIFDKNLKTRTRISYIISFCLLVTVCAILVSGICIMKAANYDRVMFWKMLHIGASYLSIALIGLHLGLYWNFVSNFFKKMFNIKNSGTMSIIIARIVVVAILVLVYWTWQNIWQGVFMFDLAHVSNYDTLFSFYENLSQYSHALLIEIVLDMISSNSVSLISILNAVVNNVRIIDILAVFFMVILFMKSRQKKSWIFLIVLYILMFAVVEGSLFYGFQVSSIDELVSILHILSMIILGFKCVIIVYLIYRIVGYVFEYIRLFE